MSDSISSRVKELLAEVSSKPRQRGNLIFALDATASRERTWDTASQLQASMFLEVVGIGGLDLQLVYFRGVLGVTAECKASSWISDPVALARLMAKIRCETGYTQIERVLSHALREAASARSAPWSMSETPARKNAETLVRPAYELGDLEIPVFMFQEGRDQDAERFQEIAERPTGPITALTRAAPSFWASFSRPLQRLRSEASWRWNGRTRMRQSDCSVRSANQSLSMVRQSKHDQRTCSSACFDDGAHWSFGPVRP